MLIIVYLLAVQTCVGMRIGSIVAGQSGTPGCKTFLDKEGMATHQPDCQKFRAKTRKYNGLTVESFCKDAALRAKNPYKANKCCTKTMLSNQQCNAAHGKPNKDLCQVFNGHLIKSAWCKAKDILEGAHAADNIEIAPIKKNKRDQACENVLNSVDAATKKTVCNYAKTNHKKAIEILAAHKAKNDEAREKKVKKIVKKQHMAKATAQKKVPKTINCGPQSLKDKCKAMRM